MPSHWWLFQDQAIAGQPSQNALKLEGADAPRPGDEVVPTAEAEALVAYLLSLKRDYALPQPGPHNNELSRRTLRDARIEERNGEGARRRYGDQRSDCAHGRGRADPAVVDRSDLFRFYSGPALIFSLTAEVSAPDVFDYLPKFGRLTSGPQSAPDRKVIGRALVLRELRYASTQSEWAEGLLGISLLAGSEIVLGDASNRLIAVVLRRLQGPVTIRGQDL